MMNLILSKQILQEIRPHKIHFKTQTTIEKHNFQIFRKIKKIIIKIQKIRLHEKIIIKVTLKCEKKKKN